MNQTTVFVAYGPGDSHCRSVLQITITLGKRPTSQEHLARQALLAAVKRLQDLTNSA